MTAVCAIALVLVPAPSRGQEETCPPCCCFKPTNAYLYKTYVNGASTYLAGLNSSVYATYVCTSPINDITGIDIQLLKYYTGTGVAAVPKANEVYVDCMILYQENPTEYVYNVYAFIKVVPVNCDPPYAWTKDATLDIAYSPSLGKYHGIPFDGLTGQLWYTQFYQQSVDCGCDG
jgi:hypothetical protein